MNKNKVLIISVILISLSAYLIYNISKNGTDESKIILKVPDVKFMGLLPLYVADDQKFFAQNDIQIEWIEIKSPGQAEKAFQSGHVNLNATTFANLLLAEIRKPGTISLFLPTSEVSQHPGSYLLVRNDSPIKSIDDLKGKKIGTYSGPSQRAYAQIALANMGLKMGEDFELIQVSSSSQIQSLFGKTFDALFTVEPYGSVALNRGARKIEEGVRTKYIANPFWVGAFEVKKEFSQDSVKITKVLNSLELAINFISKNEQKSREILAARTNITPEVSKICRLYNWTIEPSQNDIIEMQRLVDLMVDQGLLSTSVNIKELLIN